MLPSPWLTVRFSLPSFVRVGREELGADQLNWDYAAGAVFTDALLKAIRGDKNIVHATYVDSPLYADKGVPFFASKVTLGVRPPSSPPPPFNPRLTSQPPTAQRC